MFSVHKNNLQVLCCRSSWISWPLAFLLQGVFDDLVDEPALPVRFRNWNTTLRLKGTSPSRISEKLEKERRSPQRSPSTSPLPDHSQQSSCCNDAESHAHRTPPAARHRCRAHNAIHCTCDSAKALGSSSSPKMNGKI
ncbi:uncharacterized protein LOC122254324 [Penaeus japonicus]|uniref:uncharacterized protein LOC122254324 n=1 Tax=Penaeus japonicus TaxID=27405 RepID=UPI001C712BC0|nr:uncharacterized protein LOC122254324 [Penaeus japonicus]